MTACPVCGSPGAGAQSIGTNVTVFCCPACLGPILHTFARYAPSRTRSPTTATDEPRLVPV